MIFCAPVNDFVGLKDLNRYRIGSGVLLLCNSLSWLDCIIMPHVATGHRNHHVLPFSLLVFEVCAKFFRHCMQNPCKQVKETILASDDFGSLFIQRHASHSGCLVFFDAIDKSDYLQMNIPYSKMAWILCSGALNRT